jgi:ferredoxin
MEQGGIAWPSSCRNGTCRTCMAFMREGRVRYAIEWPGLLAEEKAEGWILPCCAHPLSDVALDGPSL